MEEQKEIQKTDEMLKKEMIKKVDKRKLKKLIAMCFNLKDCEIIGLDKLLENWAQSKLELYKLLGNELKIEKEINITKEKIEEIEKESGVPEGELKNHWNNEFDTFLDKLEEVSPIILEAFARNFSYLALKKQMPKVKYDAMNSYLRGHYIKPNDDILFSTLMHKVFKSEEVDKQVSIYLQKINTNIKGKIYISIDPFDYVTMSLNKSRWSSCHSLHSSEYEDGVDVGCYSAGIFSYMCDNVSTIAYKTDGELYKYQINGRSIMAESKNWRQMVFIHPEKCYFIVSRQYPYKTEIIAKIVREMVEEKISNVKEIEEDKDVDSIINKWKISRRCSENKKFIENLKEYEGLTLDYQEDINKNDNYEVLHYNDMLHDFNYQFIYQDKFLKKDLPKIYIGSNPNCVVCGENILTRHHSPVCSECGSHIGI